VIYLAHGVAAISAIASIFIYQPDSGIAYLIAAGFGLTTNLFLHETLHYITESWLGYDPIFELPNRVWTPDEALSVKDGVISLIAPQILTPAYIGLVFLTHSNVIEFMVVIALIFNVSGGFRDFAWIIRRLLWPDGHLVLVDSEGKEFVTFPKRSTNLEFD